MWEKRMNRNNKEETDNKIDRKYLIRKKMKPKNRTDKK